MKKVLLFSILLAAFAWCQTVYGMGRIIVYKGTIKASKSIVDVNDTNSLTSTTLQGYWVINELNSPGDPLNGSLFDGSAVIYNPKTKYYKLMSDSMESGPHDPCKVVMLSFYSTDPEGSMSFNMTGKGKLTKYTATPGTAKDYVVPAFKGTGVITYYDFLDTADTYSGAATISLKMDARYTQYFNANIGSYSDLGDIMNEIVADLTGSGGWTNWPYITAP
jgi:hypothetical protein